MWSSVPHGDVRLEILSGQASVSARTLVCSVRGSNAVVEACIRNGDFITRVMGERQNRVYARGIFQHVTTEVWGMESAITTKGEVKGAYKITAWGGHACHDRKTRLPVIVHEGGAIRGPIRKEIYRGASVAVG